MPKYLVEVSEPDAIAARRIVHAVGTLGSHFATHADWRSQGGVSTGSLLVEADDRWRALAIVPPGMRRDARTIQIEAGVESVLLSAFAGVAQPSAIAA